MAAAMAPVRLKFNCLKLNIHRPTDAERGGHDMGASSVHAVHCVGLNAKSKAAECWLLANGIFGHFQIFGMPSVSSDGMSAVANMSSVC